MAVNIGKLVDQFREAVIQLDDDDGVIALTDKLIETYGDEIAFEIFEEADRREKLDWEEAQAEHKAWQEQHADAQMIFDGLPRNLTFGEACRIKAGRGDPLAQRYLDFFNSRRYRVNTALFEAAVRKYPDLWRDNGDHSIAWLGKGEPPETHTVIDRFQMEYPAEAKAIEAAIDAEI
jgi:hypothetical protein